MAAPVIRPPVWPQAPASVPAPRADARAAAQKAFFEAALAGQAAAKPTAGPAGPEPSVDASARATRAIGATEARAADSLPRPGSIIDIWV